MSPAILNLLLAAKLTLAATATGDGVSAVIPDNHGNATVVYEAVDIVPVGVNTTFGDNGCKNNGSCNNSRC